MPIIRVEMFKGRTAEQKKKIARELVDGFIRGAGGGKPNPSTSSLSTSTSRIGPSGYDMMNEKYPDK